MNNVDVRLNTKLHLQYELSKLVENYMKVFDEYYSTGSRDSAFLKDLVDVLIGICACLEVYTEYGKIHPDYALEKLKSSESILKSVIAFYESRSEI